MKIGIDASRAFLKERTGIEEYSYQVVRSLRDKLKNHQVVLYLRKDQKIDFDLPEGWRTKVIKIPYLWTQLGLSLEMLVRPADVLFIPAHIVPLIHPKNTVMTVHGLEYEVMPQAYSFLARAYMRFSIKKSCHWASRIIAVSENTKKDLMKIYGISAGKISVIYEGVAGKFQNPNDKLQTKSKIQISNDKFILFIGRLEARKNITGMILAFEILKERHSVPHRLVLAGKWGYGEKMICEELTNGKYRQDILCLGYVSEEEKKELLRSTDIFLFPTFYEGFGLPVLEAQSVGVPVVTSNVSSLPEVGADSVAYCDPNEPVSIANAVYSLISDPERKEDMIKKGLENVKRFSWEKCATEIARTLV